MREVGFKTRLCVWERDKNIHPELPDCFIVASLVSHRLIDNQWLLELYHFLFGRMVKGRMKVGRFQSEKLIGNVKDRRQGYKHVVNTAKLQSFMQSSLTLFIPGLCVFLISGFATLLTWNFQNASDT